MLEYTRSKGTYCKIKRDKFLHDLSIKQYHIADIWLSCTTGTNMQPDNHKIFKASNFSLTVSVICFFSTFNIKSTLICVLCHYDNRICGNNRNMSQNREENRSTSVTATAYSRWKTYMTVMTWLISTHFCLIQLIWLWIFSWHSLALANFYAIQLGVPYHWILDYQSCTLIQITKLLVHKGL